MPLEDVVDIGHEFHALFGFAIQEAKTDGIELRIWLLAAIANLGLHFDRLFAALSDGKDALRPFLDFLAATRLHPAKADIDDHRGYWSWLTCQLHQCALQDVEAHISTLIRTSALFKHDFPGGIDSHVCFRQNLPGTTEQEFEATKNPLRISPQGVPSRTYFLAFAELIRT